jgi:hypothetical protein
MIRVNKATEKQPAFKPGERALSARVRHRRRGNRFAVLREQVGKCGVGRKFDLVIPAGSGGLVLARQRLFSEFRGDIAKANVMAVNGESGFCLTGTAEVGNSRIDMIDWESAAFLRPKDRLILRLQFAQVVKFAGQLDAGFKGRLWDGPIAQCCSHLSARVVPHGQDMIAILLWAEPAGGSATVGKRFHPF